MSEVIAGVVGLLVGLAGGRVTCQPCQQGKAIQILKDGQEVATIPITESRPKALSFARSDPVRVTSSNTVKQSTPDISIANPYQDRPVRILNISLIPDTSFKTHGIAQVYVNGARVSNILQNSLADTGSYNIPLPEGGLKFLGGAVIEVYVWTDGTSSSLTVAVLFGDYE